jgi:AcrR family transcriptional regulator
MAGDATRERLLDEAQRLFAERGYEGTSLRALADAASANIAAVNYHFRSKEGLVRAVVARAMEPVNAERDQRLRTLQAEGGRPSVEQIVRAFVEPAMDLASHHGARGPAVAKFLGRVLFDPSPRIRQLFADQVDPVEGRYLDALRDATDGQDTSTVVFGYTSMIGMVALHQAAAFGAIRWRGGHAEPGSPDDRERLIAFVTAGLTHGLKLG